MDEKGKGIIDRATEPVPFKTWRQQKYKTKTGQNFPTRKIKMLYA
jgi:hypothetical protein